MDYNSCFSNLSSYEEYVIKCNLLGKKPNDKEILHSDLFNEVEGHFWMVVDGHIFFIDSKTGKDEKNIEIEGDFGCSFSKITSLEGAPEKVGGSFYCNNTEITSLEGCPKKVGISFYCCGTKITSLEGSPEKVGGNFGCFETNITSLHGCPKEVGGDFYLFSTKITSLEGAPIKIGGDFDCSDTRITSKQKLAYRNFLKHPTPDHIDETGHYKE